MGNMNFKKHHSQGFKNNNNNGKDKKYNRMG